MMNMNLVYVIVAILTLFSFVNYIAHNEPSEGLIKRFHSGIQKVFLIANLLGLVLINKNPYKQDNIAIMIMMYALYIIPILAYAIGFFTYMRQQKKVDIPVLWMIYLLIFVILIIIPKEIKSEKILQEKADIISYEEYEVKSTFINDSIEGVDYVIVKESPRGEVEKCIIETRTYRDNNDILKLHLHQNKSYIKEYVIVDTYLSFLGLTIKEIKEEKIYEIYLTDDMYEQK